MGSSSSQPQPQHQQSPPRMPKVPKSAKPPTNIADTQESPFGELGLREVMEGMGRVRVRQHVNPLASKFQEPTAPVDWGSIYNDPTRPLFVDMGCGPGRFLLLLCRHHSRTQQQQQQQPMNYLGLEIRQPLVDRANKWSRELGMQDSVHFLFTNVTVSLAGLLENYPGPVAAMSAQFPDPHFKRRHRKRRIIQPSVVQVARERLMPGGQVFLQSDVLDAVAAMRDEFEQHAGDILQLSPLHTTAPVFHWTREQEYQALAAAAAAAAAAKAASKAQAGGEQQQLGLDQQQGADSTSVQQQQQQQHAAEAGGGGSAHQAPAAAAADSTGGDGADAAGGEEGAQADSDDESFVSSWAAGGWLVDNPLGVPTEREHYVQTQGGKVFRVLLVKKAE